MDKIEHLESTPLVIEEPNLEIKKTEIARRPEVDVIIVAVTYGILLYHVCCTYHPLLGFNYNHVKFPEDLDPGPIKEDPYTIIPIDYIIQMFIDFMHAWNMPMFFYLSGIFSNWSESLAKRLELIILCFQGS